MGPHPRRGGAAPSPSPGDPRGSRRAPARPSRRTADRCGAAGAPGAARGSGGLRVRLSSRAAPASPSGGRLTAGAALRVRGAVRGLGGFGSVVVGWWWGVLGWGGCGAAMAAQPSWGRPMAGGASVLFRGRRLLSRPAVVPGAPASPPCAWGCSGPGRVWVGGCRTVVGCPGVGWVWCGDGRPAVLGEADGRWCLGAVPGEAVAFVSGRRSGGARPSSRWAADRRGGVRGRPGETVVSGWRPVVTGCGTGAGRPLPVSRGLRAGSTVAGWAATSAVRATR
ncbi:hypothetical protein JOF35_006939 [Streptomyces demainii]|uniref:Uncharacterized protein n=1 Tax=Streptomyces demainii TaxID=588122 RepID=A0ABT9L4X1_9ACTN|nr:hypothetical protein [Streptomyces demainii]